MALIDVAISCLIRELDRSIAFVGECALLFKSGFGRFGLGQAKPSLVDQSVILVFVIGGINGREVLEGQEAVSESGKPHICFFVDLMHTSLPR
ncbi:hypothetical protein AALP_AA3G275700 [Arabis alpina]|uniref:Uncharacterized protein n=1 Tax=Arabis alpina TaxID=50452 RepID=A0A087HC31_ARAAL|nr:hypothetical protein AALP_AA3G275700 [Arabis alpina]